jgi:ribonuclease R
MEPELEKNAVVDAVRRAPVRGWKVTELATAMSLDGHGRHRLRRMLEELLDAGVVEKAPGARYRLPGAGDSLDDANGENTAGDENEPGGATLPSGNKDDVFPVLGTGASSIKPGGVGGRIRVHPAGYGFVEREDGEADVFVPARYRGTALDGDKVRLTTWMGYKGTEGRVEEVTQRGRAKLTGVLRGEGHEVFLEPDDPRIATTWGKVGLEEGAGAARIGQCVVAEITRYPEPKRPGDVGELWARVVHVLGEQDDPRTEVAKVIACADIPDVFPEDTLAAAKRTSQELRASDFADRVDLRDRPFLTIDPETARDFDDAVCVEPAAGGGYRVWVAVADVSHYVTPGSALDREARIRGCSVYLPDRAISMLPHELSSGICSLNPEVDRCAMVVRLDVTADGVPQAAKFCAAVIRSHARLDYPGVAAALAGDFRGPRARYLDWIGDLKRANELAQKMRKHRIERGALNFDLDQASVILDEDDPRRVRDVRRSKANPEIKVAYNLIEEYMLAANEAVARFFRERNADTMWRVHDKPSLARLEELSQLLASFGVDFEAADGQSPKALQMLMRQVAGEPYERALHFLMLRSLKQATYDVVPIGHFGLASSDYLHFTSPIRRYPDLIVHRLLKWHLRRDGEPSGGGVHAPPPTREQLAAMASECSGHERRAAAAEREVVDMYRTFLMRDRVQEELGGIISGVTSFGLFIECDTPYVEGLIKFENLGDEPFYFDDKHMVVRGRRSGTTFRLGDRVRVRIENVSVARRRIDLSLLSGGVAGEPAGDAGRGGGERRRTGPGAHTPHAGKPGKRDPRRARNERAAGGRAASAGAGGTHTKGAKGGAGGAAGANGKGAKGGTPGRGKGGAPGRGGKGGGKRR